VCSVFLTLLELALDMVNPSCHDRDVTKIGLLLDLHLCKLRPADHTIMICVDLVKHAC